jgi:hypothetical protein
LGRNRIHIKNSYTRRDIRKSYRAAFLAVIDGYNSCRSVIGSTAGKDYSTITGGQSAQYNNDDHFFRAIDFTVDVENAAKKVLDNYSMLFFNTRIKDKVLDFTIRKKGEKVPEGHTQMTHQSDWFLEFQEKLGQAFMAHGLFPISRYFKVIKR